MHLPQATGAWELKISQTDSLINNDMFGDLHSQEEELNYSVTGNCKQILHEFFIAFSDLFEESFSVRCKLPNTSCNTPL